MRCAVTILWSRLEVCVLNHAGDDSNDSAGTRRSSSITGLGALDGHAAACLETRCLDVTTTGRGVRSAPVISASMRSWLN